MTAAAQTKKKKPAPKKKATAKKPAPKKQTGPGHKLADEKRRKLYMEALSSGLNRGQAAKSAGVTYRSVYRYIAANPDFAEEIEAAILEADRVRVEKVEDALYLSAVGYEYEEERVTKDGDVVKVTLFQKPDTGAQVFFLKNRAPERWKDIRDYKMRAEVQMQREEKVNHAIEKLTADKKLAEKFLPLLADVTGNGGPRGRGPSAN